MDNYNLNMLGKFSTQKVLTLPIWKLSDVGRIIYVISLDRYFIGAESASVDDDGWAMLGLYSKSITNKHIDWDYNFEYSNDKISSINIPTIYADSTTNIQFALDSVFDSIIELSSGNLIGDNSIILRHIGFNSEDIKITNNNSYFVGVDLSIQNALDQLYLKTAKDIKLSTNSQFGRALNLSASHLNNIEESMITLEEYLSDFPASNVIINNPISLTNMPLQNCINSLFGLIESKKFIDLVDTPNNYGDQNQFIATDGNRNLVYLDLYGDMINVQYPSNTTTTIQNALNSIRTELDNISIGGPIDPITRDITTINASNVIYDDTTLTGITNVDDVLDYLLINAYTISRVPDALHVISTGIGATSNVQASLEHLQEYLNQAIGLIPTCLKASDIYYNSILGHQDVDASLDYIFTLADKITALEDCCTTNSNDIKKQKIYFTTYSIESKFNPCGGNLISIGFEFTTWYQDYKTNYNPTVGNNFMVIPIIQINSFVITNVYQKYKCSNWSITDQTDPLYPGVCLNPLYDTSIYTTWPPKFTSAEAEFYEAGTFGEYPYVYYHSGPAIYPDEAKKWIFYLNLGTRAFGYGKRDFTKTETARDSEADVSYSTGGDISYTIVFLGFCTDSNSLVKVFNEYCKTPCVTPTKNVVGS